MSTTKTLDLVLCDINAESALVIRGAITLIGANAKAEVDRLSVIANEQRKQADQARAKFKAAEDAEAKRVTDEVELRRKAAAAPDKAKLAAFADAIRAVGIPFLNAENSATAELISEQRKKLCDWIELKASQL